MFINASELYGQLVYILKYLYRGRSGVNLYMFNPSQAKYIFLAPRYDSCESKLGVKAWKNNYIASLFGVLGREPGYLSVPFMTLETWTTAVLALSICNLSTPWPLLWGVLWNVPVLV